MSKNGKINSKVGRIMSKDLITKLSNLKLKESSLKRCLDKNCFNSKGKARLFEELEKVENEIKLTKFKLRLEKEMKK